MKRSVHGSRAIRRNQRPRRVPALPTIGLIVLVSAMVALADQLCYNHVTSTTQPPNWGRPPLIDGSITNNDTRCFNGGTPPCLPGGPDLGWTNSFSYVFNNPDGPVTPDVIVEGIRDDKYLYLSVQANNTTLASNGATDLENAVLVAFDPDNTGSKMQWFVILPVPLGTGPHTTGNKQNTQSVDYYFNQTSLTSPDTSLNTHYLKNPTWFYGAGGTTSASGWESNCDVHQGTSPPPSACIQSDIEGQPWSMEMALPLNGPTGDPSTGLIIPSTGLFGMYINVLRITGTAGTEQYSQAPWPSGAVIPACTSATAIKCILYQDIPATATGKPSGWGNATIDPTLLTTCNGVSIGSQNLDISVSNPSFPFPPGSNSIDGMNPNVFHANVHNTSAVPASNVGVTFFIANFGLPSSQSWQQVAQAPAGAFGTATIPPGGINLPSNSWTPSNPLDYAPPNQHQCILATLSSNPPTTTFFTNNSAVQNADFFDTSRVERPVRVAAKGYPVNPEHNTEQEFDIAVTTKQTAKQVCPDTAVANTSSAQTTTQNPNCKTISQLVETAEACRHTGMYVTSLDKKKIEMCDPVGSFTFVAKHQGTVDSWKYTLTGPGLGKPDKNGLYHLRLGNDKFVDLNNVIEPQHCTMLPGFGGGAVFVLGGVFLIGVGVYRPRRKKRSMPEQPRAEHGE